MRLEKTGKDHFTLYGKIKDISDYYDIKIIFEKLKKDGIKEVTIRIPSAREVSLYILGYWLKLARQDAFKIQFYLGNYRLYDSFLLLGLNRFFEVINDDLDKYL